MIALMNASIILNRQHQLLAMGLDIHSAITLLSPHSSEQSLVSFGLTNGKLSTLCKIMCTGVCI